MKVIYHIPIMEKLCTAVSEASNEDKKIDKFILTAEEYKEIEESIDKLDYNNGMYEYYGVPITKE